MSRFGNPQELVNLEQAAKQLRMWPWVLHLHARAKSFPIPRSETSTGAAWELRQLYSWRASLGPRYARGVPINCWPRAIEPAVLRGVDDSLDSVVAQIWSSRYGKIAFVWRTSSIVNYVRLEQYVRSFDADVLVTTAGDLGLDGPRLKALNVFGGFESYEVPWRTMARVLGQPAPYWPIGLRDAELIAKWRPGAPQRIWPARGLVLSDLLAKQALAFAPSDATHQVLVHLAQVDFVREHESCKEHLEFMSELQGRIRDKVDPAATTVIPALPLEVVGVDPFEDLDSTTSRIGWLNLLTRTDELATSCVRELLSWDGGKYLPFSEVEELDEGTDIVQEWMERLAPAAPSALFEILRQRGEPIDFYIDPMTDAPVAWTDDGRLLAAVPRALPTTSDLAEVVLDGGTVWIRTFDGTVFPAPQRTGGGLTWGYSGSGPTNLAWLIDHLLDDPASLGADYYSNSAPDGLHALTREEWKTPTRFVRPELEAARRTGSIATLKRAQEEAFATPPDYLRVVDPGQFDER